MKKIILLLVAAFLFKSGFSQEYNISFPNGEKKNFEFLYDDPNKMSKFDISYYFFGFTVTSTGALTFQIEPQYRINPKLFLHAKITSAYGKKMDGNVGYREPIPSYYKTTLDIPLMAHYSVFQKVNMKEKKISIAFEGNTIYMAKLPRKMAHDLVIDAGIWYNRIPNETSFDINPTVQNDTSYFTPMLKTTSLAAGISYYKHESYKFRTDNVFTSFQRHSRLYFNLTYALFAGYDVYGNYYEPTGSTNTIFETSQGYEEPTLNRFGWRAGWEKHLGFKSSALAMVIGFDLGKLPHLSQTPKTSLTNSLDTKSPDFIFSVHFGIGFGGKIKN